MEEVRLSKNLFPRDLNIDIYFTIKLKHKNDFNDNKQTIFLVFKISIGCMWNAFVCEIEKIIS